MSWPADQSPGSTSKNSPDWSQRPGPYGNFRSPFPSPRNGQDFGGSPRKNFGWRNNTGPFNRFQNDRFHYSPGGNRPHRRGGGGHFRGRRGGHFRGPSESADIGLYVNPSMLHDPWKELEDQLGTKLTSQISKTSSSVTSTPNTSVSLSDTKGNLTEESVVISDDSSDVILVSDRTTPVGAKQSNKTETAESPSS